MRRSTILASLLATLPLTAACQKSGHKSSTAEEAPVAPASVETPTTPDTLTADALQAFAQHQIHLQVPAACAEEDADACESWLGVRDAQIGLGVIGGRTAYSLEDVTADGRFHLVVFPDCLLDERAAKEAAAKAPDLNATKPEIAAAGPETETDDPSISVVQPPADDDGNTVPAVDLPESPLASCKRHLAPNATPGAPIELLEPSASGDRGWWRLHFPAGGHPTFISTDACPEPGCLTRLLLGEDGVLTAAVVSDADLALLGFWKKLSGKISKSFNSIESGVADVKKLVRTNVDVAKLGGKKLYVTAALPATRIYSAVKEQGPEALELADGTIKDGSVYIKKGAKYTEQGGVATLNGVRYIAEYIQANACFLGISAELVALFGSSAAAYELSMVNAMQAASAVLKPGEVLEAIVMDRNSAVHTQVLVAIKFFALHASLISGKLKLAAWEDFMWDVLLAALRNDIKAGYTPIFLKKIATAVCKGTDEALSSAHALLSTMAVSGLSDDCLEGIKTRANTRYESGTDLCYAVSTEIAAAAAAAPLEGAKAALSKGTSKACPADATDEAYQDLREGLGCQKKALIVEANELLGESRVDDATVLTNQRRWARTYDWTARMACPAGAVAVGMCASGGNADCFGTAKELLCASRATAPVVDDDHYRVYRKDFTPDLTICPHGYAVTQFCASGGNRDCQGTNQVTRCTRLNRALQLDYGHCVLKESKTWDGRLQATAPNHVMVGLCSSGKNPDCGGVAGDVTKSALFCPLQPAQTSDSHEVLLFRNDKDDILALNIGENPSGYRYEGVAIRLFDSGGAGRKALHRCVADGRHFASLDAACEGETVESTLGYLATETTPTPVYRCHSPTRQITADKAECKEAGVGSTLLGYAP